MTRLVPILLFVALSLRCSGAYAKRLAPKDVAPVTFEGVRYSAPEWGVRGETQIGGYLLATDAKTGKPLWGLWVYEIKYNADLEEDVQDIFITSLKILDGRLHVANEAGDQFVVDLSQRMVVEGANRVYFFDGDGTKVEHPVEWGLAQWWAAIATVLAVIFSLVAAARRLARWRD
jgi:hypothetical protein